MTNDEFIRELGHLGAAPDGINRLRKVILALAVQGRLGSESQGDESTQVATESAVLPREVPVGWAVCDLAAATTWAGGSAFPKAFQGSTTGDLPICKVGDMNRPGNEKYIHTTEHRLSFDEAQQIGARIHGPGTVIFPKIGGAIATNKRRLLVTPTVIDNNCLGVVPGPGVSSNWLFIVMSAVDMSTLTNPGPIPSLSQKVLGALPMPLPPVVEQGRITARVDELMALCDELEERQVQAVERRAATARSALAEIVDLDRADTDRALRLVEEHVRLCLTPGEGATEVLARVRQSILDLAVRGRLVSRDPADEPASALLEQIGERRQLAEQQRTVRGRLPQPPVGDAEKTFPAPKGWEWARLGELGEWGSGATPSRSNPAYFGGGIPWVKSGELSRGIIMTTGETVTDLAVAETSVRMRPPGDLLVALYGVGTLGKTSIAGVALTTNQAICACTPWAGISVPFLQVVIASLRSHLEGEAAGGAQHNISRVKLVSQPCCIPPAAEQARIVARIDALMGLCDELEAALMSERDTARKLATSTCAAVVSGRDRPSP